MANARESHGVKEEEEAEEEVVLSKLPARHIDALDVKVASLGIFLVFLGEDTFINWSGEINFSVLFVVKMEAERS